MFKNKTYKFSPDNLAYIEVVENKRQKYLKIVPWFTSGFIICALIFILLSFFVITPKEKRLLKEKKELEIKFLQLNKKLNEFETKINDLSLKDDSIYRAILGKEPLPESVKQAGAGGSVSSFSYDLSKEFKWIDSIAIKFNTLSSRISVLEFSYSDIYKTVKLNNEKMAHTPAIMPVYNKDLKGTGAGFGMRKHPILKIWRMHEGIDFFTEKGKEVYATANGKVSAVRFSPTFGNVVIINHGFGYETYYGHLSKFNVKTGQHVVRGEVVGFVGSTGLSSGNHLHYEVHVNGKEVDPVNYFYADLTSEQYKQIIAISENVTYSMD